MPTINTYSYKPPAEYFGTPKGQVYLGVELELDIAGYDHRCGCPGCKEIQQETAQACEGLLGPFVYFKEDGSINGVELVSHPASLSYHRQHWKKFFEEMSEDFSAGSSCGLHVHLSKAPLTRPQQWAIHHFINSNAEQEWLVKLAGRAFNNYARKIVKDLSQLEMPLVGKYEAVNALPKTTLELRLFASTTVWEEFMMRLEFSAALAHYQLEKMVAFELEPFQAYVASHPKNYAALCKWWGLV